MANEKKSGTKAKKGGLLSYLIGVRQELKKVVWPDSKELGSNTVVVFAVCAFFALGFWLIDTGFLALLREVLGITLS